MLELMASRPPKSQILTVALEKCQKICCEQFQRKKLFYLIFYICLQMIV